MVSSPNRQGVSVGTNPEEEKKPSRDSLFFENLKWLTSREAVVYLRLSSEGALRNLVYRRKIPFARLGRRLRFDREALDRFIATSHRLENKSERRAR
jgi:excisionase family DNA binding protein